MKKNNSNIKKKLEKENLEREQDNIDSANTWGPPYEGKVEKWLEKIYSHKK